MEQEHDPLQSRDFREYSWRRMLESAGDLGEGPLDKLGRPIVPKAKFRRAPDHAFNQFGI